MEIKEGVKTNLKTLVGFLENEPDKQMKRQSSFSQKTVREKSIPVDEFFIGYV